MFLSSVSNNVSVPSHCTRETLSKQPKWAPCLSECLMCSCTPALTHTLPARLFQKVGFSEPKSNFRTSSSIFFHPLDFLGERERLVRPSEHSRGSLLWAECWRRHSWIIKWSEAWDFPPSEIQTQHLGMTMPFKDHLCSTWLPKVKVSLDTAARCHCTKSCPTLYGPHRVLSLGCVH